MDRKRLLKKCILHISLQIGHIMNRDNSDQELNDDHLGGQSKGLDNTRSS